MGQGRPQMDLLQDQPRFPVEKYGHVLQAENHGEKHKTKKQSTGGVL